MLFNPCILGKAKLILGRFINIIAKAYYLRIKLANFLNLLNLFNYFNSFLTYKANKLVIIPSINA